MRGRFAGEKCGLNDMAGRFGACSQDRLGHFILLCPPLPGSEESRLWSPAFSFLRHRFEQVMRFGVVQ